jgi:glycosyltransferase involved in cell wall biosynthesis
MSKKTILVHSIVFYPDGVSTAYLYNDIALELKKNDFEVVVLTTTPHYNFKGDYNSFGLSKRFFGVFYQSDYKGIKVIHIPMKKRNSTSLRIISFFYWHLFSLIIGISIRHVDYIISPSPPLSIGLINLIIGFIKKSKVIYNVQEIYPDFIINQGLIKNAIVIRLLRMSEKFIYNHSDAVVTIDKIFHDKIADRFTDKSKLTIIPNFVDTDIYREVDLKELPSEFEKKEGVFRLMYAGNIGYAQDWEPLLLLAIELKHYPVEFVVIGEGVNKKKLIEDVIRLDLANIKVMAYQPRLLIPVINSSADAHFIFMNSSLDDQGFPSKVYSILACSRPLIVTSRAGASLNNFLSDKNCSIIIDDLDIENKVRNLKSAIIELMTRPQYCAELGTKGRELIELEYTRTAVVRNYIYLVNSL